MNKICFICPRELSVQHGSDSRAVYNLVRRNMQKLFLQNQINAIHYKVSGDSPPNDKPVELGIYSSCKLVTLIFYVFLQAGAECTHSPRMGQSVSQFYQVLLNMRSVIFVIHWHPWL